MRELEDYPFDIRPLSRAEGGGFLISYPDFSECISDGETVAEAIANGRDALAAVIAALEAKGFAVPAPNSGGVASGKFVARVPKSLHAQLTARAKAEILAMHSNLMCELERLIAGRRWTQAEAAKILGIGQSRVSDLVRGKWDKFSLDMLITLMARAGRKVELAVV